MWKDNNKNESDIDKEWINIKLYHADKPKSQLVKTSSHIPKGTSRSANNIERNFGKETPKSVKVECYIPKEYAKELVAMYENKYSVSKAVRRFLVLNIKILKG
jgi:hypothetical protein